MFRSQCFLWSNFGSPTCSVPSSLCDLPLCCPKPRPNLEVHPLPQQEPTCERQPFDSDSDSGLEDRPSALERSSNRR